MNLLSDLDQLKHLAQPLHLAIGVFDGLHLGHQAVLEQAVQQAEKYGGSAVLLTFFPHPIQVIAPNKAPKALLETLEHKATIALNLGIHAVLAISFDADFALIEAEAFLNMICNSGNIHTICVGEDWRFGHSRHGDVFLLKQYEALYKYQLIAVAPIMYGGDRISSTRIRQAIHDHNFNDAAAMLGRRYTITGTVMHGQKMGHQLGFPTANIDYGNLQTPQDGVWTCITTWNHQRYASIANLGFRPTVDGSLHILEVHILNFKEMMYHDILEIEFIAQLRTEQKFESLDALKQQIQFDVHQAQAYFQQYPVS